MAKPLMIQGTMSNVGKSILTAGLCRIFVRDGFCTAPFKSQNMALNSFITEDGLEMGRAQVMQAEAARIRPRACMNPILLKPSSDTGSQVIVNGKVEGMMSAASYYRHKKEYIPVILEAYRELDRAFDIIVIEGAGSPAEINLKKDDIVNMGLAEMIDAPVILAADIDRGGVFAQIIGTIALLEANERKRIIGTVINKFRGDVELLKPGIRMLEEKTNIPVLGVVPYFHLDLDEEDSLTERFDAARSSRSTGALLDIVVIRLPRISNFTDLMALECMDEVSVRYVSSPGEFGDPDAVILPGSKNTVGDLLWMRQNGLESRILRHAAQGKMVFGICGGYQMLGEEICDPEGTEYKGQHRGMGLLPVRTVFSPEKIRTRVQGRFEKMPGMFSGLSGLPAEGYEIHMGTTSFTEKAEGAQHILRLYGQFADQDKEKSDGAVLGNVCGCYLHGIFDSPDVAAAFVSALLRQKGLDGGRVKRKSLARHKEEQYDALADILQENLDIKEIYRRMGIAGQ